MISEQQIEQALGQRLLSISGLPSVFWENEDVPTGTERPYILSEIVPTSTTDRTIDGAAKRHRGYLMAVLVGDLDKFATPNKVISELITAHFPQGLRLTIGDGEVVITKPPDVKQGFRVGPSWRLPIRIDYLAY